MKTQIRQPHSKTMMMMMMMMREIDELDIEVMVDTHRREELMAELAQHVANRYLFIHERRLWEDVTRFTRATPITSAQRFDRFMYYMVHNVSAHLANTKIEDYERMYGKPADLCKKMKAVNDGYEPMRVEWIPIPTGPAHERQDSSNMKTIEQWMRRD